MTWVRALGSTLATIGGGLLGFVVFAAVVSSPITVGFGLVWLMQQVGPLGAVGIIFTVVVVVGTVCTKVKHERAKETS